MTRTYELLITDLVMEYTITYQFPVFEQYDNPNHVNYENHCPEHYPKELYKLTGLDGKKIKLTLNVISNGTFRSHIDLTHIDIPLEDNHIPEIGVMRYYDENDHTQLYPPFYLYYMVEGDSVLEYDFENNYGILNNVYFNSESFNKTNSDKIMSSLTTFDTIGILLRYPHESVKIRVEVLNKLDAIKRDDYDVLPSIGKLCYYDEDWFSHYLINEKHIVKDIPDMMREWDTYKEFDTKTERLIYTTFSGLGGNFVDERVKRYDISECDIHDWFRKELQFEAYKDYYIPSYLNDCPHLILQYALDFGNTSSETIHDIVEQFNNESIDAHNLTDDHEEQQRIKKYIESAIDRGLSTKHINHILCFSKAIVALDIDLTKLADIYYNVCSEHFAKYYSGWE